MARILAIDYGERRIGLAISDEDEIFAFEQGIEDATGFLKRLPAILEDQRIGRIVLGYPLNMSGKQTQKTSEVLEFKQTLQTLFPDIPVELADERLSSQMAATIIGKDKGVDGLAAQIFLQNYLNSHKKIVTMDKKTKQSTKQSTKTKRHPLVRVIHPNRYFIWAIVALVGSAAVLFAYIKITDITAVLNDQVTAVHTGGKQFFDSTLGFKLMYPPDWQIEMGDNAVTFDDPVNTNNSVTITKESLSEAAYFKKSLKAVKENDFISNGMNVTVLTLPVCGRDCADCCACFECA